ncbi:ubiquinone biosynthesis O-methyltransferase, mitochondrial-like isoform X2 [Acanthaster planci]|uniref:Ubiquinone biosynthesis O-methyltransferase, mitochondrial n=1 Tax=Acanthaster planci TaxID=133434 RepID=A0A8B7XP28_ACAPL|nr:ubiquinone biosynthesis O-methyltransferase, mitochondrial-like isoform X2 [Acanthaster planci]
MKLKSLFRVNRIFVQKWCQRIQPVSHVSLLSGMSGVVGRSPFLLVHKPTCKIKSALGHIGRVFPRPQHSRSHRQCENNDQNLKTLLLLNRAISDAVTNAPPIDDHDLFSRISHLFMNASFNFGDQRLLHTTVDEEEVAKFRSLVQSWWDVNGEFQALHSLNDLRVPLIRDGLVKRNGCQSLLSSQPLADTFILDVGCGGGILSEPLARLGATVIGIDAASENIQVAREHASHDRLLWKRINYICATAEELLSTNGEAFDAVIASEVLEHVSNVEGLVATCSQLTKPAGSIFFTTINKTWLSFALAIVGAEDIAGVVPSGTHDWNKFIPPQDLQRFLHASPVVWLYCWLLVALLDKERREPAA